MIAIQEIIKVADPRERFLIERQGRESGFQFLRHRHIGRGGLFEPVVKFFIPHHPFFGDHQRTVMERVSVMNKAMIALRAFENFQVGVLRVHSQNMRSLVGG